MTMKLVNLTAVPITQLLFLRGQIRYMQSRGFEIHCVSSPGKELDELAERDNVTVHPLPMARKIKPLSDLVAVWRLMRLFRRLKPTIVHLSTPKAALLGALASALAGVPIRLFLIRGSITKNSKGLRKRLFRFFERLTVKLAHYSISVSPSLLKYVRSEGIVNHDQGKVLLHGSSNGVDGELFNPDRESLASEARTLGSRLGLPGRKNGRMVISYIGRLAADKGITELHQAWQTLKIDFPNLHLLLVGPLESEDPVSKEIVSALESDERVHMTGLVVETAPYYALSDVVVLPTHREGFSNVLLEAGAMRVPAVASRVAGCVDAIVDGVTGTLVPPRDSQTLADAIREYLQDPGLRARHGQAGRERVLKDFQPEMMWEALYNEYVQLLRDKDLPVPERV